MKKNLGSASFGNNHKGKVIGIGKVSINPSFCIENVSQVDGLKYNLISISQLCDKGYFVTFTYERCIIRNKKRKQHTFHVVVAPSSPTPPTKQNFCFFLFPLLDVSHCDLRPLQALVSFQDIFLQALLSPCSGYFLVPLLLIALGEKQQ